MKSSSCLSSWSWTCWTSPYEDKPVWPPCHVSCHSVSGPCADLPSFRSNRARLLRPSGPIAGRSGGGLVRRAEESHVKLNVLHETWSHRYKQGFQSLNISAHSGAELEILYYFYKRISSVCIKRIRSEATENNMNFWLIGAGRRPDWTTVTSSGPSRSQSVPGGPHLGPNKHAATCPSLWDTGQRHMSHQTHAHLLCLIKHTPVLSGSVSKISVDRFLLNLSSSATDSLLESTPIKMAATAKPTISVC